MNKFDDYIKKELEKGNLQNNNDWNLPSEKLWDNVHPHFPTKKKSKWIIWFFVLGFCTISFQSINKYFFEQKGISNDTVNTVTESEKENNSSSNSVETKYNYKNTSPLEVNKSIKNAKSNKQDIRIKETQFSKQNNKLNNIENNNISIPSKSNKETNQSALLNEAFSLGSNENRRNELTFLDDEQILLENKKLNFSKTLEQENEKEKSIKTVKVINSLLTIESIDSKIKGTDRTVNFTPLISKIIKQKPVRILNNEFGASHALSLFSVLNYTDLEIDEPDEQSSITGYYRNANFYYTKWLNPKYSFTTGLLYTNIGLNVCFENRFEYEPNDFFNIINQEYKEITQRASSNSEPDAIDISLIPGYMINTGDSISLAGKVNLKLNVIQVPFFFNINWIKKNTSFHLGAGATAEFVTIKQNNIDLNLYDDGMIISEPSTFNDQSENYFDYTLYLRLGMRRKIFKNIHFGIDLKPAVMYPALSSIDFGVYYQWNN